MSTCEARVRFVTRSTRSRFAIALGLALASFVSASAEASQAFPSTVMAEYDMPCAPTCTLCHTTNPGQAGTAFMGQPFGRAVFANGALPTNVDSLKKALAAIKTNKVDSDGDKTPDFEELAQGDDPGKAGEARLCGPNYGCGAHIAKAPAKNGGAWVLAACAAALVTFGFRRRRSS
jgi:hypothetical protein